MRKIGWILGLLVGCGTSATPDRAELTTAAGRVSGGKYVVAFQLGHWTSQEGYGGGTLRGSGAAVVKP